MDLNEMLEDNRGGILSLAKKFGIIGMDITGSNEVCEVFDAEGIEFLVEFAPEASSGTHEELQQALLALLGQHVELVSAEELDGHIRRIVIKEAGHP
ncbi:MAG: hypothetical protein NTZ39_09690 [Methanoregula sp.]|nr:hypothetical protein [Methanoregula sp.]